MPYTPPAWNAADIAFDVPYTVPAWNAADIEFADAAYDVILPAGLNELAFGTATVSLYADIVAAGFSSAAFGTAQINRTVSPAGADWSAIGAVVVQNQNRIIEPSGFTGAAYGTAVVFDPTQFVAVYGGDYSDLGVPFVENLDRTVYPQRIDPTLVFGDATIVGPRYISGTTIGETQLFGDATVVGPRTVLATGSPMLAFGVTDVQLKDRTIYPQPVITPYGYMSANNAVVFSDVQYVYPDWTEEIEFHGPIVGLPPFDVLEASSIDGGEIGDHEILNTTTTEDPRTQRITQVGIVYAGAIPLPRIWPAYLRPQGITGDYGRAFVSNFIRTVSPNGISAFKYGTPEVQLFIRYVNPTGWDRSVVWNPYGPIDQDGNAPRVYNQYGGVSGLVAVDGIDGGAIGSATVARKMC